jgi:hypothetical protein
VRNVTYYMLGVYACLLYYTVRYLEVGEGIGRGGPAHEGVAPSLVVLPRDLPHVRGIRSGLERLEHTRGNYHLGD